MEHKGRAREGGLEESRSISVRDFPIPRTGFNPKSSSNLSKLSYRGCTASNRLWTKNRGYRKQTIKPLLAGSRFAYKLFEILHAKQTMRTFLAETRIVFQGTVNRPRNLSNMPNAPYRRGHLNFASRGSKFEPTVQPVCSYNVVHMPSAPSSFRKRLEMRHHGKFDLSVNLENKISNSN